MNHTITSKKIEEGIGLRVNTLHYYIEAGAIIPDVNEGSGRGTRREFSETNFIEAVIIMELLKMGFQKKRIVQILKGIRAAGERDKLSPARISDPRSGFLIVGVDTTTGEAVHRFVHYDDPKALAKISVGGACSIVINLPSIYGYSACLEWFSKKG